MLGDAQMVYVLLTRPTARCIRRARSRRARLDRDLLVCAHDAEAMLPAFVLFAGALSTDPTGPTRARRRSRRASSATTRSARTSPRRRASRCSASRRRCSRRARPTRPTFTSSTCSQARRPRARPRQPDLRMHLKTGARLAPARTFCRPRPRCRSFNDLERHAHRLDHRGQRPAAKVPAGRRSAARPVPVALIHFEEAFLTVQLKRSALLPQPRRSRTARGDRREEGRGARTLDPVGAGRPWQRPQGRRHQGPHGRAVDGAPQPPRLAPTFPASTSPARRTRRRRRRRRRRRQKGAARGAATRRCRAARPSSRSSKRRRRRRGRTFAAAYAQKAAREAGKEADADDKEDDADEDEEDGASSVPPSECWPMPNETEESEAVAVKPPAKRGASSKRVVSTQEEESEEEDEDEDEDEVVSGSEPPSQKAAAPRPHRGEQAKEGRRQLSPEHRDHRPRRATAAASAGAGASSSSKPRPGKSEPPKETVPHNGFEAFVNKMKPGLQMQHPKASARDIRKKIGEMCKAMDEDAKAQYKAQSEEGLKGKAPAAPKEAAKAKKPREVEAEEEDGRDEEDAEMIDAEKTLAPVGRPRPRRRSRSRRRMAISLVRMRTRSRAADEAGGVETVEKVSAPRLSFSSTTKRNDGAGGGPARLNSMLGAFLERHEPLDGAGDDEEDEDDEMGEDDDDEEAAGDESMPEIAMPAPSAAAGSKKRPRSADPPPPALDLDDDDDDDDDGHDVSGAMTQIGQMLSMILEKHQAKKRQKMAAVREQAGRDTKAAAAKADAEIAAWEEKMLARQKKQEAAVAAVHKALSTKLAGAQADGEAEARRVHERSESAVRKAVAELTAASHRSKSRLEEATKGDPTAVRRRLPRHREEEE